MATTFETLQVAIALFESSARVDGGNTAFHELGVHDVKRWMVQAERMMVMGYDAHQIMSESPDDYHYRTTGNRCG